jgi:GT2 family glycosyltransferase
MATNFGESFNIAVNEAFTKYDEIIVANDDIVLHPTTYIKLLEDVAVLKQRTKIGWVVAKSDNVRPLQDIRNHPDDAIFEVPVASPLFGYISKQAWINYPPLNWFSDDIQCLDIAQKGFKHFVSRAYVHHVGSSTIGSDNIKNKFASESWIKAHRPDLHKLWFSAAPRKAGLYI